MWNLRMHIGHFYLYSILMVCMVIFSCGDETDSPELTASGSIGIEIKINRLLADDQDTRFTQSAEWLCEWTRIQTIEVDVYGQSENLIAAGGPWRCSQSSGLVEKVRAGKNISLVVLCRDSNGRIIYHGIQKDIVVMAGQKTKVQTIGVNPFIPSYTTEIPDEEHNLLLKIESVPDAVDYRVIISKNETVVNPVIDEITSSLNYAVSGLSPGTYFCRVYAIDAHGNSSAGSPVREVYIPASIELDEDGDGYTTSQGDCNDGNDAVHPNAIEQCNNIDDDCDGTIDEGIETTPTTCGTGACTATGELTCVRGAFVDTCITGSPSDEICDGLDNDCDGSTDEGLLGRVTTCGIGECAATGFMSCNNGAWQDTCAAGTPGTETCDGLDNDCDGSTDEGLLGRVTTCGIGECAATGFMSCNNGAWQDTCAAGTPGTETCDGLDNDCDGSTDEGLLGRVTTCGIGECAATGFMSCNNGAWQDTCVAGTPSLETCDGLDNDCDGSTDEGILSRVTTCGIGECAATGFMSCVRGEWYDTCIPGNPVDEICDNALDDDCDGLEDEGCNIHIMVGDNDGYGYGIRDGEDLPTSNNNEYNWIFDNREDAEINAEDGARHTDYEPYSGRHFAFAMTFYPVNPRLFNYAEFILDVSGIQSGTFGYSTLYLNGDDFSEYLPNNQGIFGSDVVIIRIYDASMFSDGVLNVEFQGGMGLNNEYNPDAIAFDFFSLQVFVQ